MKTGQRIEVLVATSRRSAEWRPGTVERTEGDHIVVRLDGSTSRVPLVAHPLGVRAIVIETA